MLTWQNSEKSCQRAGKDAEQSDVTKSEEDNRKNGNQSVRKRATKMKSKVKLTSQKKKKKCSRLRLRLQVLNSRSGCGFDHAGADICLSFNKLSKLKISNREL